MLTLTSEEIKNIAGELQTGLTVYLNVETKEVITILDSEDSPFDPEIMGEDAEVDPWQNERNAIYNNPEQYLEFEDMSSDHSFNVMVEFLSTVKNQELQKKLELGLSLSRPFRNFKDIIGTNREYELKWYEFKNDKYAEYVEDQIEAYNNHLDLED